MDTRQRVAAILLAAGIGLLAAAFLFLGTSLPSDELQVRAEPPGRVAIPKEKKRRWTGGGAARAKAAEEEPIQLPADGEAPTTESCRYIVKLRRRGVHAFNMMDYIRDRGMRFTEDDVACLSASGVDDVIINFAEHDLTARDIGPGQKVGAQ